MSTEPIRYGVLALGRSGWDIHIAELRKRADAKVVAVADPIAERRKQAEDELGCKSYPTLAKMLKDDNVEVIVIATPSMQHAKETKQALKAGKHVVCEKPMAMSLSETDSVIKAAKESGKQLLIHQNYRFWPEFNHFEDVVKSGVLGQLYHLRHYQSNFARRNDWQTLAKNGGGVLNNTCPHFIDVLLMLMGGTVVDVMGDLQQIASAGDVEDHVKLFMRSSTGVTADMEVSQAQSLPPSLPPLPKWILCGTSGTLVCDGKESIVRWFDPATISPLPIPAIDGAVEGRKYGNGDVLPWQEKKMNVEDRTDKRTFYDNVWEVLREGKPMRVTHEQVREIMRVISLARKKTKFPGKPASNPQVAAPAATDV